MAVDFQGIPSELLTGGDDIHSGNQNVNDLQYWSSSESSSFGGLGSSSSDLNTPVGSELDSTETESDEDGFMAELTRKMADYMLEEEDDDVGNSSSNTHKSTVGPSVKPTAFLSNQTTQFNYQLRNQQQHVRHPGSIGARRGKKTESTQRLGSDQPFLRKKQQQFHPIGLSQAGSGMRAVFLGGAGSRSACSGTGVFLPRGNTIAPEPRKKTGCSTVLIPARVLQALELHFNNMEGGHPNHPNQHVGGSVYKQQKRQLDSQTRPTMNYDKETQLPQEWTY